MLIEIGLAVACIAIVAVITSKGEKLKRKLSPNATHPLDDAKHSNDSFLKAREHYKSNRDKDALRDIDNALDLQPECKSCLWLRAKIFIALQQYQEAILDCNEIIELDDGYSWAYALRGNAYLLLKRYDEALEDLDHALLIQPDMQDAHISRLRVYYAMGQADVGDAILQKQLKQNDNDYIFYLIAGHSNYNIKRYEQAIEYTKKAINYPFFSNTPNKSQFEIFYYLAWSYFALKDYESALKIYNQMAKLNVNPSKTYPLHAKILRQQSKFRDAKEVYELALEESPKSKNLLFEYSTVLRELNLYTKGLIVSNKLLTLSEKNLNYHSRAYHTRALHYLGLNEFNRSLADLTKAIELNPNEITAYHNLSIVYRRLKDFDKALENDAKIMEMNEQKGLLARASTFTYLEQYDDAIRDYDRLIELAPDDAKIYNQRSWFRSYIGDYQGALLDGEQAISLDNSLSHFFSTQGQANWLIQRYEKALEDFKYALELADDDLYQLEVAIALLKLDKQGEAISIWQKVTSDDAEFQSAEAYQDKYRFAPPFYEAMQELEKLAQQAD